MSTAAVEIATFWRTKGAKRAKCCAFCCECSDGFPGRPWSKFSRVFKTFSSDILFLSLWSTIKYDLDKVLILGGGSWETLLGSGHQDCWGTGSRCRVLGPALDAFSALQVVLLCRQFGEPLPLIQGTWGASSVVTPDDIRQPLEFLRLCVNMRPDSLYSEVSGEAARSHVHASHTQKVIDLLLQENRAVSAQDP